MKNKNRLFLLSLFLVLIRFLAGSQENTRPLASPQKDKPNTHNMLVVGEKAIFLSHLPMFQEKGEPPMPHRYQAILEVNFEKAGSNPEETYFKDRKSHPATRIYTLHPQQLFVMPDLVASVSQSPLRRIEADVSRGHLEKLQKDEGSILPNVVVNIKRVVHFREFDPAMKKPAQLEYLLFGKGGEFFLAHFIANAPDFDQVLAVKLTGRTFSEEELAKGLQVSFPGTVNTAAARLKEKQKADGEFKLNNTVAPQKVRVKVVRELYFEEGELRVPAVFDTTTEEKKAGFF